MKISVRLFKNTQFRNKNATLDPGKYSKYSTEKEEISCSTN